MILRAVFHCPDNNETEILVASNTGTSIRLCTRESSPSFTYWIV